MEKAPQTLQELSQSPQQMLTGVDQFRPWMNFDPQFELQLWMAFELRLFGLDFASEIVHLEPQPKIEKISKQNQQ